MKHTPPVVSANLRLLLARLRPSGLMLLSAAAVTVGLVTGTGIWLFRVCFAGWTWYAPTTSRLRTSTLHGCSQARDQDVTTSTEVSARDITVLPSTICVG